MENKEIINIWKELKVSKIIFEFSCGGDNMNNTNFYIYNENNELIENETLVNYFDDEIYRNITFYEISDGHYIGEFGEVIITLDDNDKFNYFKNSTEEFEEIHNDNINIKLNKNDVKILKEFINGFSGTETNFIIDYKKDFIMNDEIEKSIDGIQKEIEKEINNFLSQNSDEYNWAQFSCTTNNLKRNILPIDITFSETIYK